MNDFTQYLEQCNKIITNIRLGGKAKFTTDESGLCHSLNLLIRKYTVCSASQKAEIKEVLEEGIQVILGFLMPMNFEKMNFTLLPIEVEDKVILIDEKVTYTYGDLQIALLVLRVSLILKNEKLFHLANMIGMVTKYKEEDFSNTNLSADFRTGTIGVALLYQTMFFLTKIAFYDKLSQYWYKKSKELFLESNSNNVFFNKDETIEAIRAFETPQNDSWRNTHFLDFDDIIFRD
ncbi:MAG: hypothetical protein MUF58_02185 [Arcicella sp.]|jgi:hypothetical protein|nr:hypothetical protein [Arcicella sp.]